MGIAAAKSARQSRSRKHLPPNFTSLTQTMSDDSHNSGPSPNHTIGPSVDGSGIFGVTVDEGNNKEEISKEDAVPSETVADPASLDEAANVTEEKPQAPAPAEAQSPAEAPSVVSLGGSSPEKTPEKRGKKKKKE